MPQRLRPPSAAVLLCNPFGEEATRAHRVYRVLATQLERVGYPVLRFDYAGTGDSMGDSGDASIGGWISDIREATQELMSTTGARRPVAVGLRLGGTLAALASSDGGPRFRHLVLWDPVVDGAQYLRELAAMHRAYAEQEGGFNWGDRTEPATGVPTEALGTPIGATLGAEIAAIDLPAHTLQVDNLTVISTSETPALVRLRTKVLDSPVVRWMDLPASPAWNSDIALNAAIVPMDIVQAIVGRVQEISP